MMETKQCSSCERVLNIKRFAFVDVDGVTQRSDTCRLCSRRTKHCPGCDRTLPKSEFSSDKSRPDGKAPRCRTCKNAEVRAYRRKTCDSCGTEMPKGSRARRCEHCYRKHALERASSAEPHGVLFPGLGAMKRPKHCEMADFARIIPTQTV